jgi:hypothetical protein
MANCREKQSSFSRLPRPAVGGQSNRPPFFSHELVRVHAGRHGMAIIGFNRGGAAGERRKQDDRTESGKKNKSHKML